MAHAESSDPDNRYTAGIAQFVSSLRYDDLPAPIVTLAKYTLIDALGCATFGKRFPWCWTIVVEITDGRIGVGRELRSSPDPGPTEQGQKI